MLKTATLIQELIANNGTTHSNTVKNGKLIKSIITSHKYHSFITRRINNLCGEFLISMYLKDNYKIKFNTFFSSFTSVKGIFFKEF